VPQEGRSRVRFPVGSWKFPSGLIFLSALSTPVGHPSFQINDYQKKKSGPARRADNSAVLGVPNVKARIEA
jgi:hypothetical protein